MKTKIFIALAILLAFSLALTSCGKECIKHIFDKNNVCIVCGHTESGDDQNGDDTDNVTLMDIDVDALENGGLGKIFLQPANADHRFFGREILIFHRSYAASFRIRREVSSSLQPSPSKPRPAK